MREPITITTGTTRPQDTIPACVQTLATLATDGTPIPTTDLELLERLATDVIRHAERDELNDLETSTAESWDTLDTIADEIGYTITTHPGDGAHYILAPTYTLDEIAREILTYLILETYPDGDTHARFNRDTHPPNGSSTPGTTSRTKAPPITARVPPTPTPPLSSSKTNPTLTTTT